MTLGERIRKSRNRLKITQQDLAQALGMTPQHISAIEKDKGAPSLAVFPKLAEELGVSVDYLLTGKESVITDIIPAIKADERLKLKVKRALIALVEELREPTAGEDPLAITGTALRFPCRYSYSDGGFLPLQFACFLRR